MEFINPKQRALLREMKRGFQAPERNVLGLQDKSRWDMDRVSLSMVSPILEKQGTRV